MDVKLSSEAVEDRKDLSDEAWNAVKSKIMEVSSELTHRDLKLVPNPFLEHPVWQLTVDNEQHDYRVYLDVRDGDVVVIAIWDFEFTHQGDTHWEELEERL